MNTEQIKQMDSEAILSNPVFKEAIEAYRAHYYTQSLQARNPEDAFKAVLAMQASEQFLIELNHFIQNGQIASFKEAQDAKKAKKPEFKR